MNGKLEGCMLNNGLMAQRVHNHMDIAGWLKGFAMVYGVGGMGCVKEDGLRCHITRNDHKE